MKSYRKANLFFFGTLLSMVLGAQAAEKVPRYTLTHLETVAGFPFSRTYAINKEGIVAGQVAKLETVLQASPVLWDGKTVRVLEVPEKLLYGAALGINGSGQIVGGNQLDNYGSHGFDFVGMFDRALSWKNNQNSALSEKESHAWAINERGQIAGTQERNAALWDGGKTILLEQPPHTLFSVAKALNSQGQVTGMAYGFDGATGKFNYWALCPVMIKVGLLPSTTEGKSPVRQERKIPIGTCLFCGKKAR